MPPLVYVWLIRKAQAQDTVFMNEFSQFLQKNQQKFSNLILHISTDTPEDIYFQGKRISGFLSEHLVTNSVFHLHQWGLVNYVQDVYQLNTEKLSKIFSLSSTVVLTNIWKETHLDLTELLPLLQKIPVQKGFIFANNPHLNIHTQEHTQVSAYPDEQDTAELLSLMSSSLETWVSHLNNISKII
jgi:hypothetical protein